MSIIDTFLPVAGTSNQTLATRVYERLRDDIVFGVLPPGYRLRLEMLTNRYSAGMTPIREALYRLSASMLVSMEDRRGFTVASVSAEHFREVSATRIEIETALLRRAFEDADAGWSQRVREAYDQLIKVAQNKPMQGLYTAQWEMAHRQFHEALCGPARLHMLKDFEQTIWDHAARYRNLTRARSSNELEIFRGHGALVDAVVQQDAELGCVVLRRHIDLASAPMLERLKTHLASLQEEPDAAS